MARRKKSQQLNLKALAVFLASAISAAILLYLQPADAPENFSAAKVLLRETVYADQNYQGHLGTLYCGCDWQWTGKSGGVVDMHSCGYTIRSQAHRAKRIEWEHIVPASWLGRQRQCWQEGGRKNCNATDPVFNVMEADMHNLSPVIGEVNADRSNYRFGVVKHAEQQYGRCSSKTDFNGRVFEPRDEVKGFVARVNFYIHDRYQLSMSPAQQKLFMDWHTKYPVSEWELERNNRIAKHMGHDNEFVTGKRQWQLTQAVSKPTLAAKTAQAPQPTRAQPGAIQPTAIKGNKTNQLYHIKDRCPSFAKLSERNTVYFKTEQEAQQAGYKLAGNCRTAVGSN